jgi:transposase
VPGTSEQQIAEDLVAIWRTAKGMRFQNYRARFTILDAPLILRTWIDDLIAGQPHTTNAPAAWREWIQRGKYRPLKSTRSIEHRSRTEQVWHRPDHRQCNGSSIGSGVAFARGRDFAAWLGLVPKQMSTGDRTILGRISKRGNRYLRTLFMQGARVILLRPANWAKHSFGPWLAAAAKRLHHNVLATAVANKLARIAWTMLVQGRSYQTRVTSEMV